MDFFIKEKHAYVPIGSSGSEGVSGRGGQSQQLPLHVGVGSKGGSEGVSEGVSAARLGKIFGLVGVTLFLLSMLLTSASPSLNDGVSDGVSGGVSGRVGVENEGMVWSSNSPPFSITDPREVGYLHMERPEGSLPAKILEEVKGPLPTNSWCENLFIGQSNTAPSSSVFQVPYIIDTASTDFPGLRIHGAHVQANDRAVMMTFENENSLTLGAVEDLDNEHVIKPYPATTRLAVVLSWYHKNKRSTLEAMRTHVVRGSPYVTMEYFRTSPLLVARRALASGFDIIADKTAVTSQVLKCGDKKGGKINEGVTVQSELEIVFDQSDTTWVLFVSQPTTFICNSVPASAPLEDLAPGVVPENPEQYMAYFELKATSRHDEGLVVRLAMSNNCTTGVNRLHCPTPGQPNDRSSYTELLREHASVFPTGNADVSFTFPSKQEAIETMDINFNWAPTSFEEWHYRLHESLKRIDNEDEQVKLAEAQGTAALLTGGRDISSAERLFDPDVQMTDIGTTPDFINPEKDRELLMFALPHHQDNLHKRVGSSNALSKSGFCTPTLHGKACLVTGSMWTLSEKLRPVSYNAEREIRDDMKPAIKEALRLDLKFEIPENYRRGAGDTYFSGKMLAKLGRILVIAEEMGFKASHHGMSKEDAEDASLFEHALHHLQSGVEVWLNGKADSPMVFDSAWGGVFGCGCDYQPQWGARPDVSWCGNAYPNCPAVVDAGQNFGAGFYNDHHFHYGYHIYAAAVLAKLSPDWARLYHERVLVLIRDIANPSSADPFFTTFRHKDWYLGSSWASGIVTIQGDPYPNGRNQESSAEAIAAYEAVALYGLGASSVFGDSDDPADKVQFGVSQHIYEMGRLLLGTEITSTQSYYHVRDVNAEGVQRIYPDVYTPKVVGMLWSMLAQEQTWFGNEEWKSYGIQLLPVTVASEARDDVGWVKEMLPEFERVCSADPVCTREGWSVTVLTLHATLGNIQKAWSGVNDLPEDVFSSAGGNGHSRSNTLWYIATRPAL